ncbi:MAG TPA: carbonic anhydrase family protein [Gemmatimonadales bacterium]|nr:carbonic anhydrase family protein [Gemmatimonadales bacterium]
MRSLAGIVLLGLIPAALFGQAHAQSAPHWGYEGDAGPQHWGDLEPDYAACKSGTHQSPIDIRNPQRTGLPQLTFDYHPVPLKIINNGHSIQVDYAPGSFITVGTRKYQLIQFHFHHPSEETINGHAYDMVAHLVHRDADGHLAVVAVLFKQGHANPLIQRLWDHLPMIVGSEMAVDSVRVSAADLLPGHTGYFTFDGSLTTPPCTEGVRWLVLSDPAEISSAELHTLGSLYPNNARPTQPLNGRIVQESR